MPADYTIPLWLLKLGSLANLYFLVSGALLASGKADACVVIPAVILFAVSAYRCLFPVRYENNVVFHDSVFSSIFATRLLATFAEVAYIFLFSLVLRRLNAHEAASVTWLSWLMVALVVISQIFVWAAILSEWLELYFWEELGWLLIFVVNTMVSVYLYRTVDGLGDREVLLWLSLVFGAGYLPWQVLHLRSLWANARNSTGSTSIAAGLTRSVKVRNQRTDAESWGGVIGLTWMTAYWAALIPLWVWYVARVLLAQ